MMWSETIPYRIRLDHVIRHYKMTAKQREELQSTYNAYIAAYRAFVSDNSDETMINLIGTYARWSRVMWALDDKYGG